MVITLDQLADNPRLIRGQLSIAAAIVSGDNTYAPVFRHFRKARRCVWCGCRRRVLFGWRKDGTPRSPLLRICPKCVRIYHRALIADRPIFGISPDAEYQLRLAIAAYRA